MPIGQTTSGKKTDVTDALSFLFLILPHLRAPQSLSHSIDNCCLESRQFAAAVEVRNERNERKPTVRINLAWRVRPSGVFPCGVVGPSLSGADN
jgi:hypothetical protein